MNTFSFVQANVAGGAGEDRLRFTDWWARAHQPEWVSFPGFRRGWFLELLRDHPGAVGAQPQQYAAVYEVAGPSAFNQALAAGPPWGPWQRYVDDWLLDWTRTYRRVISGPADGPADPAPENSWALVSVDLAAGLSDEAVGEFNHWYDTVHVPELLGNPGFRRAWRLEHQPDPGELNPYSTRYLAIYEVADADDFAAARDRRSAAGITPWAPWNEQVRNFGVALYRVVHRTGNG